MVAPPAKVSKIRFGLPDTVGGVKESDSSRAIVISVSFSGVASNSFRHADTRALMATNGRRAHQVKIV